MELELTKTEKILAIAMISLVAFLILRNYYSKKKTESSYNTPCGLPSCKGTGTVVNSGNKD